MRLVLLTSFLLLSFGLFAQNDYRLQVNNKTIEISTDKEYKLEIEGQELSIRLFAKDTLVYKDDLISFQYPRDYKISQVELEEGIEQLVIMTASGSGILIQKYTSMNPTMLNDLMLAEITKESLSYGYSMTREDYSRVIKSGQTLQVDKAILTYKDETNIYEIASIGSKDEGILIMTMKMDNEFSHTGQKLIDLMWNSIVYKNR